MRREELPPGAPTDWIRSVARAAEILRVVGAAKHGLTVDEIAAELGVRAGTVRHLVATLLWAGYLRRWDDGRYGLGPAVVDRARELSVQVDARRCGGATPEVIAEALRVPVEWLRGLLPTGQG